ncbi:MAG: hypothetical protein NC124_11440 [Clostridium sp.]|nr:hypothetical protein [Clostridium sp.]
MNEHDEDNDKKEDIIIWIILIITAVIAFIISQSIGMRGRTVLYILVGFELIIYGAAKWILDHFRK